MKYIEKISISNIADPYKYKIQYHQSSPIKYHASYASAMHYNAKRSMLFETRRMQSCISYYKDANFISTSR